MKRLGQIRERALVAMDYPGPVTIEESATDITALLRALDAGREVIEQLEATYPSGLIWADKYRAAITTALAEGNQP